MKRKLPFTFVCTAALLCSGLLAAGISALWAAPRPAPPPQSSGSGFRPVDNWAAAVMTGDADDIKRFYFFGPGATAQTPQSSGRALSDPGGEESTFWATLPPYGLVSFVPRILEQTSPKPNEVDVVLRVEMTFHMDGQPDQHALVSVRQAWVQQSDGEWLILRTARGTFEAMPKITLPQPKIPNTHLYPDPGKAQSELAAALASAKADHKRVLVVFGANWCYDCHVLDATLHSPRVAPLVAANYHVVHVNIGEGEANSDLADRFQVPLKKGIPSLAVLDPSGKLITSQKQGEFESAAKIGMSDVLGFLNRWKPPHA